VVAGSSQSKRTSAPLRCCGADAEAECQCERLGNRLARTPKHEDIGRSIHHISACSFRGGVSLRLTLDLLCVTLIRWTFCKLT